MRSGALKHRQPVARPPDDKPIARVGNMALVAAKPRPFERVHVMALPQDRYRTLAILRDKVDDFVKRSKVAVLFDKGFHVSFKSRRIQNLKHLQPHSVEHFFCGFISVAPFGDDLIRLAD